MIDRSEGAHVETTDRRYVRIGSDEWWDTTGIEIVSEAVVAAYMAAGCVGIAVFCEHRGEEAV